MFDSSTKFPNGVLIGSTYDLGNFDECVSVDAEINEERIQGKYCLATVKFDKTSHIAWEEDQFNASAWNRIQVCLFIYIYNPFLNFPFQTLSKDPIRRSRNELNVAICVPASCSAIDVETHLDSALSIFRTEWQLEASVHVDPRMCQIHEPFSLSIPDLIVV